MVLNSSGNTEPRLIAPWSLPQVEIRRRPFNLAFLPWQISSFFLLLKFLIACSSQSSADELAKELQTVKSWTATAHMVGDLWTHGDVPTTYAKQTLEKTQEELKNETDTLSKLSIEPSQHSTVLEHLKSLEDTVSQMSKAVEQKDAQAMTQQIQQLSTQEQTIDKLVKTAGGQP